MEFSTAHELRLACRSGAFSSVTSGMGRHVQCNLTMLPKQYARDFLTFCKLNPEACPVVGYIEAGSVSPGPPLVTHEDVDIRTDVPMYRVFRGGKLIKMTKDVSKDVRYDYSTILIGCSFSFESALLSNNIPVRNIEQGKNVSMYITNRSTNPYDVFSGPIVVTMRPIPRRLVQLTIQLTQQFKDSHGEPIHIGDPADLGITDISKPDFGDSVVMNSDEDDVCVFWCCGVTGSLSAIAGMETKPDCVLVTHAPGHMFVADQLV